MARMKKKTSGLPPIGTGQKKYHKKLDDIIRRYSIPSERRATMDRHKRRKRGSGKVQNIQHLVRRRAK